MRSSTDRGPRDSSRDVAEVACESHGVRQPLCVAADGCLPKPKVAGSTPVSRLHPGAVVCAGMHAQSGRRRIAKPTLNGRVRPGACVCASFGVASWSHRASAMSTALVSPSGQVRLAIRGKRWRLRARGVEMRGRGFDELHTALYGLADVLDRDGIGVPAGELRSLARSIEDQRE